MNFLAPMSGGSYSSASPLPFPVTPKRGESIAEMVLRAAAENSYQKVGYVLSAAGISHKSNYSVPAKAREHARDLACTLGTSGELVSQITPSPVPGRPGWSYFFNVPMRDTHRAGKFRRLSPRSLRKSMHLKAIWSVKVFSFDPLTREQLLAACPECSRQPTYLRTFGLQHCEFCTTIDDLGVPRGRIDFRDYPQPLVEVEDDEALQFVTDLIDPERQRDPITRSNLHPDLREFGPGDIFELVVAVACAMTCPASWNAVYLDRPAKAEDYARFTPEVLATAGRTILSWPKGFDEVADEVRASAAERSGYYSLRKELAPLVALTRDYHLPERMRVTIRSRIKQNAKGVGGIPAVLRIEYRPQSDFVPLWDAASRFSAGEKTILKLVEQGLVASVKDSYAKKSPILVNCQDLQAILELRRSSVEARSVAYRLGIPRPFLTDLVQGGHIAPVTRPDSDPETEFYSRVSVEQLMRRCRGMARDDAIPAGAVRLGRAVSQRRLGSRTPWAGIVERLISGEIEIWPVGANLSVSSYLVRNDQCLGGVPPTDRELEGGTVLSQGDAAAFLGSTATRVNQLARAGLLSTAPTTQELEAFTQKYVLSPEVVQLLTMRGIKCLEKDLPRMLRLTGIEPHSAVNGSRGYVWRRDDIARISDTPLP